MRFVTFRGWKEVGKAGLNYDNGVISLLTQQTLTSTFGAIPERI